MAKGYWVSCYRSIKNPDGLAAYAKLAAHETADYQTALKALGDGAERDFRVVEGLS